MGVGGSSGTRLVRWLKRRSRRCVSAALNTDPDNSGCRSIPAARVASGTWDTPENCERTLTMADPKLEEFCRAHDFKPNFLRDMQRYLRDEIQPKLEEREQLLAEREERKKRPTKLTPTEVAP